MRIIAGQFRGRKLNSFEGEHVRPTSDRLRERIFSILQYKLGTFEDLRVADIFAGTGALGLEAISRGAGHALFIEKHDESLKLIRSNIDLLKAPDKARVIRADARQLPKQNQPFDLVFMDPPYGRDLETDTLLSLLDAGWLNSASLVILELPIDLMFTPPEAYKIIDERTQGKTRLLILALV